MTPPVIIDANILIRYLLADHPQLSPRAKALFDQASSKEIILHIDSVTVAEVVWTLNSQYQLSKDHISSRLKEIVSQKWLKCNHKRAVLLALELFSKINVDYIDAWVFSISKVRKHPIASFDADFKKLKAKLYSW